MAWSWDSADNAMPSMREELDREIAQYRQQVANGLGTSERIMALDRLITTYQPMGLTMGDLEAERSRLVLAEQSQQARASQQQGEATTLYDRGVYEYHQGQYRVALETFREAERLSPADKSIKELRRKLTGVASAVEAEEGKELSDETLRLAVNRYLENDPKRAVNALIFAQDSRMNRPEFPRIRRLIEADYPDQEAPKLPAGVTLIDHKLQLTLEAIYDGRYLAAVAECSDILDLDPNNVVALTRLGSAYFAMSEREKAKQIWTKALQLDPKNDVLRKFLYGNKGSSRVESPR